MIEINIQMPEKCGLCPCFHHENPMYCQAVKADKNKKIVSPYGSPRPEWCPLKEQEEETSRLTKMCKVLLNRCKAIVNADGATCAYCTLKEECDKIYEV